MKHRIKGIFIGFVLLAVLVFISMASSVTAQTFTSAGPITFTNGVVAAAPYPAPIYIGTNGAASLPGTVKSVTLTLTGYSCEVPDDASLMVEAPNGTAFEFMSGAGGTDGADNLELTFMDGATAIPSELISGGTFESSAYSPCDVTYPSPAPTVYGTAQTCGTSTFASEFTGVNPNGTWQLFLANQSPGTSGSVGSWSLNFTVNPPSLAVNCYHNGNFCQGESGAQCFVVITDNGPGPTGGSPPITVTDTFNSALTPIAVSGYGWSYSISGQTMTCTQTNQIAQGASYPTLTIIVNVSSAPPPDVVNSVTVTGSDQTLNSGGDTITINPLPAATITPSPANPYPNSSGNQASAPAGASSYSWTITNGVITSATNLQTITYTAGSSGSVGLTVLASSDEGCTAANSASVPLSAEMELIDVNFNTNSLYSTGGGVTFGPAMSGAAVLGAAGDQWNEINVSSGTGIPLIYANGSTSPVTMTFTSAGGYNVFSYGGTTPFVGTPYEALMENYLYNGRLGTFAPQTITLSGLEANSLYNLVLYNAADTAAGNRTTYFTVNSNTLSSTWNSTSSTLIAGTDYVEFPSAMSDGSGNLAITWNGSGAAEGDINGFQIQVTNPPAVPPPTATMNWNSVDQRIDGFGASSAWQSTWNQSEANLFFSTSNNLLYTNSLGVVSTNNGVGLSLLRNHIAYAGTTSASAVPTTVETSIMQMAQALGARVWSTPWTPPAGFKSINDIYDSDEATAGGIDGGSYLGFGNNITNLNYASQLANYVASMKTNYGVNLYAISIQNEPDAEVTSYEACQWTNTQIHDFVTNLYAALAARGLSSTKIIIPEDENWETNLFVTAMNDPAVGPDIGILACHDYYGQPPDDIPAPLPTFTNPNAAAWETEVSILSGSDDSITNGLYWAGRIHLFMTVGNANAWHYWWLMTGNSTGNQGLTDENASPTKRLFALGQFSRFVRPGYYRIGVNSSIAALISAYRDSSSPGFAIVAINTNSVDLTNQVFALTNFPSANFVTPWVTSASLSLANQPSMAVTNTTFVYTLPAMSIVTFVSPPTPQLGIGTAGPGSASIFWPDTWNFVLQTNTNLASTNWSNFSGSITSANGTNSITITPTTGNVFFRLTQ